ncbi:Vasopressin V1a receptor [Halotydeus destructor]|nr:Vasopressin V1a receptor [Halotydeus destructor]
MSNMTTSDVLDELSSPKVQVNMTSDERYTRFVGDIRDSVRIELTVYTVCFVIGATCNLRALYKLSQKANKNRVNYLIRHLVLADLMVAFFAIFPEIIWRISVTWNAGVVLCKLLNTVKAFTLYLSSNIIVCISLDR